MTERRSALLSVYNKEGLAEFANGLIQQGWRLLASGGTAAYLKDRAIVVEDIAVLYGERPILGHRVVSLSRKVHAGLLARRTDDDQLELAQLGVPRIDLVCVDLYPLEQETSSPGRTLDSVIEKTDVGGPTLLHAAAKGQRIVICDPADRIPVLEWLRNGSPDESAVTEQLGAKAELVVARYLAIAGAYRSGKSPDACVEAIDRILKGIMIPGNRPRQSPTEPARR